VELTNARLRDWVNYFADGQSSVLASSEATEPKRLRLEAVFGPSREGTMPGSYRSRINGVIGFDGSPLTSADLPAPGTQRWVIRRKAVVVAAIRGGLISLEEACNRYALTADEFLDWQYSTDRHGLLGLSTTRIQKYPRRTRPRVGLERG
jgi:hypothetical protein